MASADTRWKLLTIFFIFATLCVVLFILWNEHQPRTAASTSKKLNLEPEKLPDLSAISAMNVQMFVDNRPWVAGATVDRVNFTNNTRETIFGYFKNRNIKQDWPAQSALFGNVEVTNRILVDMLNGNMACLSVADAVAKEVHEVLKDHVTTLCMVRIPPIQGGFSGFITMYLTQPPSPIEFKRLITNGEKLALEIYGQEAARQQK